MTPDIYREALARLERVRETSDRSAIACCPAHEDRHPSLSIAVGDKQPLVVHCFAGCTPEDVLAAIGLTWRDACRLPTDIERAAWRREARARARIDAQVVVEVAAGMRAQGMALSPQDSRKLAEAERLLGVGEGSMPEAPLPPTADQFQGMQWPRQERLIGPLHSQQIVLLAARQGLGKTQMALGLADSLTRGEPWCGWECDAPRRVLYIDGEMPGSLLQERLALYQRNVRRLEELFVVSAVSWLSGMAQLDDLGALNLAVQAWVDVVVEWCRKLRIHVLMLDNLMSLVHVPGISLSSDEYWRPMFELCRLLRGEGLCVVVIDHHNTLGQVHGTKTKLWHADLVLGLRPLAEDDDEQQKPAEFEVHVEKCRRARDDSTVPFVARMLMRDKPLPDGQVIDWVRKSVESCRVAQIQEMMADGMSMRAIARELGWHHQKVRRMLEKSEG